jgi:extracellular factor (EF) 3-hydroxypalmitic acid methyl ester biosynthesis protein
MERLSTARSQDMRKYERKPFLQTIHYGVNILEAKKRKWLSLEGKSLDISEAGICLQTDYPLSPGHILWFNGAIEDKAGFVRWCRQLENEYRVGVELDKKNIKKLDEATYVFNNRLEDIEKRCSDADEDSHDLLKATADVLNNMLGVCEAFENEVADKNVISDAQIRFREKTNQGLSKSYFINRARTWPQGYQGDYKMLENIYRNTPLSENIGYYLDLGFLSAQLATAVRGRLKTLETILSDELQKRKSPHVLNIACGSCREVFELASDIEESGAKFTCIDLDDDALAFAANRLSFTSISPLTSEQIVLRKYNALRMFDHELNMKEFGMQDIIYSVGLFDYLPTDFLITLLKALYRLIAPGGTLITSFKDASRYRHQEYHWIVDWDGFLQRTEDDFRSILSDAGFQASAISETREESGVIVFYTIAK